MAAIKNRLARRWGVVSGSDALEAAAPVRRSSEDRHLWGLVESPESSSRSFANGSAQTSGTTPNNQNHVRFCRFGKSQFLDRFEGYDSHGYCNTSVTYKPDRHEMGRRS